GLGRRARAVCQCRCARLASPYAMRRLGTEPGRRPRSRLLVKPDEVPLVSVVVGVAPDRGQPLYVVVPAVGATAAEQRGRGHLRPQDMVQLPAQLSFALEIYLHGEPVEDLVEFGVPEVGEVAVGLLARGLVDAVAGPDGRAQVGPSQAHGVGDDVKRSGDLPV